MAGNDNFDFVADVSEDRVSLRVSGTIERFINRFDRSGS